MTGRAAQMPRWAQFFVLPALLLMVWILGQTIGHALFIIIVSTLVALILNPLVRKLRRLHIPRGLAVLLVYLSFVAAIGGGVFGVIGPVQSQVKDIQHNLPTYTAEARQNVRGVQAWFNRHHIDVNVQQKLDSAISSIRSRAESAAGHIVSYSLDVIAFLITFIVIVVASIYMLLDAPRIGRFAQRVGGPEAGAFLRRTEKSLTRYVLAQVLVSLIIGVTAGVVLWIYGVTGLFDQGSTYAIAFGAWVFVMEFVPYLGPVLGAVPPVLLALFTSPLTALWVVIAFIGIHQLEGHIVVPKIMGKSVGVHPLVVIFGLIIGEQLYGIAGILIAIPMVVVLKEAVRFASERFGIGLWEEDEGLGGPPPRPPDPASTAVLPLAPQETRELPTGALEGRR